jgi:hypothetical protein
VAGLLGLAVALAHVHLAGRPSTLCTLRALTGVPCPFCGATTAAVRIGSADLTGGLRASPLAVLSAPLLAGLPVLRSRWRRWPRRAALAGVLTVLAASEVWQLHRFGLV